MAAHIAEGVMTMMTMRTQLAGLGVAAAALIGSAARAEIITFDAEGLTGPSFASQTSAMTISVPTSIGNVVFSNGAILTNEASLPADTTSVYYSSFFLPGTAGETMTITFPAPIQNFFLDLYNGETFPDTFTVSDNTGATTTVTISSNSAGGNALISFPAVGNVVTITTTDTAGYDFSIDNIGFNQATPNVPEPAAWALMLVGFGGLGVALRASRRAKLASA
jgi:hypothetical protein